MSTDGRTGVLVVEADAARRAEDASDEELRRAHATLTALVGLTADAVLLVDRDYRVLTFNAAAERIFGWSAADARGLSVEALMPTRFAATHHHHVAAFEQKPTTTIPMEGRRPLLGRRKDGAEFPATVSIARFISDGASTYVVVVRDISQQVQHEEHIARMTHLYAVLSGVNSAIVRIDDEAKLFDEVCRVATATGRFHGASIGVVAAATASITTVANAGAAPGDSVFPPAGEPSKATGSYRRTIRERAVTWENNLAAGVDATPQHESLLAAGARAAAWLPFVVGEKVHAVMVLHAATAGAFGVEEISLLQEMAGDVSFALDHIAKTRQVAYLATHDALTGLPNRALLHDRLTQLVATMREDRGICAVIVLDLARLRNINDSVGRRAGDELLRQVGQRLQGHVEDLDILANIGGDRFVVATRRLADASMLARIAEQALTAPFVEPFDALGNKLHLAARGGIAVFPTDGTDVDALIGNAETALRDAKAKGDNYLFFAPSMNAAMATALRLENRLRGALERNEFILHYQPKVDLETRRIVSLEALIRWQDPETGLVPPLQFIPLLEETGLILPVGQWAMQEAVRTAAALRAKGLPPVRIAVNVSPIQLRQPDFASTVAEAIKLSGDAPHDLDIEITESVMMHDLDANIRTLAAVRALGVELAIDDFGTGYSSLAYIARLPVSVIKIDRAFIKNLNVDADSISLVQMMISLTHSLKRKVVAEGVETEEQAQLLRLLRCDQFQGYLFSKPVTVAEIERLLSHTQ